MCCKKRFVKHLKALKKNSHSDQGCHLGLFPNLTKWFQRTFGNIKTGVDIYFQIWITKRFQRTFGNIITGVEFYLQIFNNGQNHIRTSTLVTERHLHVCCTLATDIRVEMVAKRIFQFLHLGQSESLNIVITIIREDRKPFRDAQKTLFWNMKNPDAFFRKVVEKIDW